MSRSAVYLVHKGAGRRHAEERRTVLPGVKKLRNRMLSQAVCERPVTRGTG
jgi:hypothetical protein